MYLKSLELYGFKSFAERTEFEFAPGITAVVGPNGSGKSNVSDAIRWVLGEQSAKSLRGMKMEDVIFAGSDSRKPINYSEVALTLDNSDHSLPLDYSEVTITRRVYRSGESEFLLNKQSCRLKDITELLMDTGLGKEAYSIIGQGRIDEILSTKAEDRRGIFEEAAGVVKYKNRKKEASRKLEETEANLVRIQDIIHEVGNQLEPLHEQAEKAKRYRELKQELKQKEIAACVHQIDTLHRQWEEASKRLEALKREEEACLFQLNGKEAEMEKMKWQLNQLEQKLDDSSQRLLQLTEEVEKLEGQREVLKERKKNFSTNKKEFIEQLQTLEKRRQENEKEWQQENERLTQVKEEISQLEARLTEYEEALEDHVHNVEERLEHLKGAYIDHLNEQASMKHEVRLLEQSTEQLEMKMEKLQEEHKRFLNERKIVHSRIRQKEKQLAEQDDLVKQLTVEEQRLHREQENISERIEQCERAYRETLSEWEQNKSRVQLLQEMKEDFTGFHQGVREVLKARDQHLSGIEGAIAELIQVPRQFETAIQTALGTSLQHIVVRDEKAGREAINYLKKGKRGRATFLPLNVMKARHIPKHDLAVLEREEGFIGVASQLISCRSPYRPVIDHLLGLVVITHSLKEANKLARAVKYRYRFVSLQGDVVNPGGSMTGGTLKKSQTNLLGREREIEQLMKSLQEQQNILTQQQDALNEHKQQLISVEQRLQTYRQQIEQAREDEQILKEECSRLYFQKNALDEKLEGYDQEADLLVNELKASRKKKEQLVHHLTELQQTCAQLEADIQRLEKQKEDDAFKRNEKNEEMNRLKIQLARKKQELQSVEQQIERISQAKQELADEWDVLQQHLQQLEGDIGTQQSQEDDLEDMIHKKKEAKESLASEVENMRQKRKEIGHVLTNIESAMKEIRHEHAQIEDLLHKEEVKVNRLDVALENDLTLLREEYELSYELAKEQYPLPAEYATVKKEVERLKADIEAMGTIHLGAIEEYERTHERYQFLKKQEEDLLQAKQTLYEVIEEMDMEMTKRFKETFDQVRSEFLDIFRQLFGGGRADLHLTDPDDLLHTGVEIVAQPPGKKLQHIGLLSGGEKALTALVLLFAILKVKPVPFCVLDEVEAALDEANVTRFAQYLRKFAKQTQFIVITHRKGTMEEADVLYGVTMQESGVSQLVSVKLEEKEEVMPAS